MSDDAPTDSVPVNRLFAVTGALSIAAALLAAQSLHLGVLGGMASIIAQVWAIAALLLTGVCAPTRGHRRLGWLVFLTIVYAALLSLDLTTMSPALLGVVTFAVLSTGALVGGYIGALLEYPGMLMVVAYVAAFADCFSFVHPSGVTANVLADPKLLALLTVPFPVLGTDGVASLVGIGDVTFVALFITGARQTGLSASRTVWALGAGMAVMAVAVAWLRAPLPALPVLGAAVVLVHPEARRVPAQQVRRVGANLVVVTLVLGGLLLSAVLRG